MAGYDPWTDLRRVYGGITRGGPFKAQIFKNNRMVLESGWYSDLDNALGLVRSTSFWKDDVKGVWFQVINRDGRAVMRGEQGKISVQKI
jgi:hypothetical protein